ncbi:MAG: hypothetical protein ACAI44_05085, partial [Candidatus Sericytochromatia bacterium]
FHILAFEANKVLSLGPETLDPGPQARWITPRFIDLWQTIGHKVWAQWRYQHDRPDYPGPRIEAAGSGGKAVALEPGPVDILAFCGGGKDSLVALKLLERAGIPYASLAYAHSIYGLAAPQHALMDGLLDHCAPVQRHKQWVSDTFLDAPVAELYPEYEVAHLLAAETPSSIFGVLPIVLSQGYKHIALAHERSADTGNLIWEATGEDVNHQWGKSLAAEELINGYIQQELISGFTYFSLLKPLYDVVIFSLLQQDLDAVPATHSCNLAKPWCRRCPKCAYVWLNFMAYLPTGLIDGIFAENLLDLEENQLAYRQMIGLEAHTPFECIGQIPEARLAFELARRKGLDGRAMAAWRELPPQNWDAVLAHYCRVVAEDAPMPAAVAERVLPLMERAAAAARDRLKAQLAD